MNATPTDILAKQKEIVALLCVADSGDEAPIALAPLYGQPLLHHLIKSLESRGISRFFIGIENVPGALLSYSDSAKKAGLDIGFVRNPGDLAAKIDDDNLVLVQTADARWDGALLDAALTANKPLLATVEEQSENQLFERIDLNSRWAGLALLERRNMALLTALPEGWDMGSALLRQALQDGVERWPIGQKHLLSGALQKLRSSENLAQVISNYDTLSNESQKSLEKYVFSGAINQLLPSIWMTSWSRSLVEWLSPMLAALSATLAISNFPLFGGGIAAIAIFASLLRQKVRAVEYRSGDADWLGKAGWSLLAITLGGVLFHAELSRPEGGFVWISAIALSLFAKSYWKNTQFWLSSPLTLTLAVTFGQAAGLSGWAIRLVVLAELGALLLSRFRGVKSDQPASDRP